MFLRFYGLKEQPFGVTPDPRFIYPSRTHSKAFNSLFCGIEAGCGFLALIAKPGMGKTTLLVGRRFVLIIGECQNLDNSVLETVRLLSDFGTPRAKLMQIILAGQTQLADKLSSPSLAQLRDVATISSH